MQDLQNKTAFITGGASGIGLGIAKACGNAGMNVVIADIRQSVIDEALQFFSEKGWPAYGIQLDVTNRDAYKKAADDAEAKFGRVHLLVNNAGVEVPFGPIWESTFKDCDYIVGVNIFGVLNGILTFVPRMLEYDEPCHVVSTASMAGLSVVPRAGLYSGTKHAVVGLMETLASDLVGTKIGASAFCPGPVVSNITPSSIEVRPEILRDGRPNNGPTSSRREVSAEDREAMKDFVKTPEEIGERVVRGIRRGDLYILTHIEFIEGMRARGDAVVRAFPADPFIQHRYDVMRKTGSPIYNTIFDAQTTPEAFKKD